MTTAGSKPGWVHDVTERLSRNQRIRRALPGRGRLHIDRQLPFLCVYRQPENFNDSGMARLVVGEAAYLRVTEDTNTHVNVSELIKNIIEVLVPNFGAFLILELWSMRDWQKVTPVKKDLRKPVFRIFSDLDRTPRTTLETLRLRLREIRVSDRPSLVSVVNSRKIAPAGHQPVLAGEAAKARSCYLIGLEISPIYRDAHGSVAYPLVRQALHHKISRSLKQTFFQFMTEQTPKHPEHFHTLGRRAVVKAVWDIDNRLAKIINGFDFIMLNTPVNVNQAWKFFKRYKYQRAPTFWYRPLPFSPPDMKRRLFKIPVHRVEDPTLATLFEEERSQIDLKISMLRDRGTSRFLFGSLQVYGGIDRQILKLADAILTRLHSRQRGVAKGNWIDALEFAETARKEVQLYQQYYNNFNPSVKIRKDISTLTVNRGNLLIAANLKISVNRVNALIQHEIGTHLIMHYNGAAQPLKLIRCGLPGYEELQEGLAVFAELMVGGLNRSRLRVLAARVVAAAYLINGASFVEICNDLRSKFDFDWHMAFLITTRIHRGGGLTKDVAYLRGLVRLLDYLKGGGDLDPLFVGKFAISHVPVIEELLWRQVLRTPPLRPRYLESDSAQLLLKRIRDGLTVIDLVEMAS